jgi:S1-C subfamily serine protease
MRPALVRFSDVALVNWFNILEEAERQGDRARAILDCALADYPNHQILLALMRGDPPSVKGPDLNWQAPQPADYFEKIIGAQSTLMPISFLELGTQRSHSVARVVRADRSSGTGFLIGRGWLLTNNHVLPSAASARDAIAEFNYQLTADGLSAPIKQYQLIPERLKTSEENDWTAIGIDESAEQEWGTIRIEPTPILENEFVNIIQHPGGGPKQIALYHNTVAYVGNGRVQYLTDTLPGSSGSPVFNSDWKVVALHHSGGMLRQPGTKKAFYRNEGIDVAVLLRDLTAAGVINQGSAQR